MSAIPEHLQKKFSDIVAHGNVRELKDFLISNLKEFPDDVRDQIILAVFEDAVTKGAKEEAAHSKFKKEGIKTIEAMERLKKSLQAKAKLLE